MEAFRNIKSDEMVASGYFFFCVEIQGGQVNWEKNWPCSKIISFIITLIAGHTPVEELLGSISLFSGNLLLKEYYILRRFWAHPTMISY